jgi:integrase
MVIDEKAVRWLPKARIFLPHEKTKAKKDRAVPISTRLRGILEMRRCDPNGKPYRADAYVFGTEVGTKVLGFKRAWISAVLKAHGETPTYTGDSTANFSPASRAAFRRINLRFHDLRREAGSRWMDGGVPIATIQRWLGHANVSQTSTYLAGTETSEHDHMARYEATVEARNSLVTSSEKQGKTKTRKAVARKGKPNKTGVGRETTIN